jgi:hypothetical protein
LKTDKANILKNISIYQRSPNSLRISGIPYLKADITIYNILGIKILEASFESKEIKDIELPRLKRGFYIIALKTKLGILHKKMILGS